MASSDTVRKEYNADATSYDGIQLLPIGKLESQLFAAALGDATGATILDLGGGTGLKARQALDSGAASVDIVDISSEMLNTGRGIEVKQGQPKIRWFEGDASKPLDHLELGQYDIVMANWLFDHATSDEALDGMWQNIAKHIKPGGRFVGVRSGDPKSPAITSGKYGVTYRDFEDIPGGFKLRYDVHLKTPISFEATVMEASYSGSTEMHEKFGFEDVQTVSPEDLPCIQEDRRYWQLFLDYPCAVGVRARKKRN